MLSKVTPTLVTDLGYKIFLMFATINIGGMAVFSYFLPETKNKSLEEMDILFGSITAEARQRDIVKAEHVIDDSGHPVAGSDVEKGSIQEREKASTPA